eukprot:g2815.t1
MSGDGHNPYYVHTKGNCINNGYLYIWSVRNCVEAAAFNRHLDNNKGFAYAFKEEEEPEGKYPRGCFHNSNGYYYFNREKDSLSTREYINCTSVNKCICVHNLYTSNYTCKHYINSKEECADAVESFLQIDTYQYGYNYNRPLVHSIHSLEYPSGCLTYFLGPHGWGYYFNNMTKSPQNCSTQRCVCSKEINKRCTNCSYGYFSVGGESAVCSKCERGTYNDKIGQSECKSCSQGNTTLYSGATAVTDCVEHITCNAGEGLSYIDIRSNGLCDNYISTEEECREVMKRNQHIDSNSEYLYYTEWAFSYPTGCLRDPTYNNYIFNPSSNLITCSNSKNCVCSNRSCNLCNQGYYSAGDASPTCKKCEIGKYSDQKGQSKCKICSQGKSASNEGSSKCVGKCNAGSRIVYDDIRTNGLCDEYINTKEECDTAMSSMLNGDEQRIIETPSFSLDAPKGCFMSKTWYESTGTISRYYTDNTGFFRHMDFNANFESAVACSTDMKCICATRRCIICPIGYYATDIGAPLIGKFVKCETGTYNDETGQTDCKLCPLQKLFKGATVCCGPGMYQTGEGTCFTCPKQEYCLGGTSCNYNRDGLACMDCKHGYYSLDENMCIPCPESFIGEWFAVVIFFSFVVFTLHEVLNEKFIPENETNKNDQNKKAQNKKSQNVNKKIIPEDKKYQNKKDKNDQNDQNEKDQNDYTIERQHTQSEFESGAAETVHNSKNLHSTFAIFAKHTSVMAVIMPLSEKIYNFRVVATVYVGLFIPILLFLVWAIWTLVILSCPAMGNDIKIRKRGQQINGVVIFLWITLLYSLTLHKGLSLFDCTKSKSGYDNITTLDLDPTIICYTENHYFLINCGVAILVISNMPWVYYIFKREKEMPKWEDPRICPNFKKKRYSSKSSDSMQEKAIGQPCYDCDYCDYRLRYKWFFDKYHRTCYNFEFVVLLQKILAIAIGLFFTTRKDASLPLLISSNIIFILIVAYYKPYLTDYEVLQIKCLGRIAADINREKKCLKQKCGTNNALDILLLIAETCICISALMIHNLENNNMDPTGNVGVIIFEITGLLLFISGYIYFFKEAFVFIFNTICRKKKERRSTASVIPAAAERAAGPDKPNSDYWLFRPLLAACELGRLKDVKFFVELGNQNIMENGYGTEEHYHSNGLDAALYNEEEGVVNYILSLPRSFGVRVDRSMIDHHMLDELRYYEDKYYKAVTFNNLKSLISHESCTVEILNYVLLEEISDYYEPDKTIMDLVLRCSKQTETVQIKMVFQSLIRLLEDKGGRRYDELGMEPLHLAIRRGNIERVRELLSVDGANVNETYKFEIPQHHEATGHWIYSAQMNAIEVAFKYNKNTDILKILMDHKSFNMDRMRSLNHGTIPNASDFYD